MNPIWKPTGVGPREVSITIFVGPREVFYAIKTGG